MRGAAESIVRTLQEAGYQAVLAGGCVRDMLLGQEPSDYDVATSAPPERVLELFPRGQKVGAQFGVILVRVGKYSIEIATFRKDLEYLDGRHPNRIEFAGDREDALRRDFTINGMFYDPLKSRVVDHVGGQADIRARIVRAIGDPEQRIAEDHLRMLRAVRFAARLDFEIEPLTWSAIQKNARKITQVSPERIRDELEAMLSDARRTRAFLLLCDSGLLQHLWPSATDVLPRRDDLARFLAALPEAARFEPALFVLLHALSETRIRNACDALRCSNASKREILWYHEKLPTVMSPHELTLADLKLLMAHPAFGDLMDLFASRLKADSRPPDPHTKLLARASRVQPEEVAPPPLLNGHDLLEMGVPQGPIYKRILERVYYLQLNEEITDRDKALEVARRCLADAS